MKRKRFGAGSSASENMNLQITPMASVFTVILVFLLKSVSMSVSNITPGQELTLPEIAGSEEIFDGIRVEVSPNAILVDDKNALTLEHFTFDARELDADGSFKKLNDTLAKERGIALTTAEEKKLLIMADVKTPYSTLKRVLASAANGGYFDLKLIVVEDER